MNKLMCRCDVQVRRTLSYSVYVIVVIVKIEFVLFLNIHKYIFNLQVLTFLFCRMFRDKMAAIIMITRGSHVD
jgi:hypothetical protein